MKKILIDAFSLLSPLTGIGRYTYEISKRLQSLTNTQYELFFSYGFYSKELYGSKKEPTPTEQKFKKFKSFMDRFPLLKKGMRTLYSSIAKMYAGSFDLYFQPNFIPNKNVKAKKILCTLHDFSFKLQPQWHPKERLDFFNAHFDSIKLADHIITGSNFTKQEIIDYLQMDEDKITVIYHGVCHELYKPYPTQELQKTKTKFDLPELFLLFVGSIEPRKNLLLLLQAYDLLPQEQKEQSPLVLVGFKGWENQEVMQQIQKNQKYIRYLGYVTDEELAHIYNLATLFIYPSLYEGFGLPPLEAMACGTPVIVSNVSSLPEVCADAAIYINPTDKWDIKEKISSLLNDEILRAELSKKSKIQAALFSWDSAASQHLKLFKQLIKEHL